MSDSFINHEPEEFAAEAIDMGVGEGGEFEAFAGDDEGEADEFSKLFRKLRQKALPLLLRVAPLAARAVMGGAGPLGEDELVEDELDGELFEGELDEEEEGEAEDVVPGLSAEDEAIAESLAAAAMVAPTDEEAAGLVGGVTIQILGPTPIRIRRMTPVMVQRATRLVKVLRRSPRTRPLVPVVSSITKATTRKLVRRAAAGKSVTPRIVAATMAKQTARTLKNPRKVARALVRNRVKRRRLNRRAVARAER